VRVGVPVHVELATRRKAIGPAPSAEQQISKMAMRRVLDTTFARLASADADIQEVHRHWQATVDKPNRKSKPSTEQSALQYKQRLQNALGKCGAMKAK